MPGRTPCQATPTSLGSGQARDIKLCLAALGQAVARAAGRGATTAGAVQSLRQRFEGMDRP